MDVIGRDDRFADILYRFADGFNSSINVGWGWADLIEECHEAVVRFDPHYKVYQVKEKYGGLRYYAKPSVDALIYKVNAIITPFEHRSYLICEVCGSNGNLRRHPGRLYIQTLCVEHGPEDRGFVSASLQYVSDSN